MIKSLYQDHFGIRENPFSIIPDPHYLYMSQRHQDALAHLAYGISGHGGFVLLTGEVGTGKTTICRALIENLPEDVDLALILNPTLSEPELMAAICDEMRIPYPASTTSLKVFFDLINAHLLHAHARGRNPVLMIDESQNLTNPVLELIRLLTNLETSEKKLLQIILVGQPELNQILAQPSQRQTAQRITARYHLMPLTLAETRHYIHHRLSVAGLEARVFSSSASKAIFKSSRGIPRLINSICDRALLAAYVESRKQIGKKLAKAAAREVFGTQALASTSSVWGSLALVLTLTGLMFWVGLDPYKTGIQDTLVRVAEPILSVSMMAGIELSPQTDSEKVPPAKGEDISQTKGTFIDELIQAGTPDTAFQFLFVLWDLDYLNLHGASPCDKAKTAGLSCGQGETDLTGLKAMNRPVVASFVMPDGEHLYGVVRSIVDDEQGGQVSIEFPGRTWTMTVKSFALRWPGDYLVVWKNPSDIGRTLTFGHQGPDVQALRRLMALAGYGDGENDLLGQGSHFFGPSLREKIKSFQTDFGLAADGIATPETVMRITGVAEATTVPLIYRKKG